MAVIMDTLAILVATATVTGIVITMVQDVTRAIGDRIAGRGRASHLLRPSPWSGNIPRPRNLNVIVPSV
jgi:hypothetical protein